MGGGKMPSDAVFADQPVIQLTLGHGVNGSDIR